VQKLIRRQDDLLSKLFPKKGRPYFSHLKLETAKSVFEFAEREAKKSAPRESGSRA